VAVHGTEKIEAVTAGHEVVEEDSGWLRVLAQEIHSAHAVSHTHHRVALSREEEIQGFTNCRVVIDDEDRSHGTCPYHEDEIHSVSHVTSNHTIPVKGTHLSSSL